MDRAKPLLQPQRSRSEPPCSRRHRELEGSRAPQFRIGKGQIHFEPAMGKVQRRLRCLRALCSLGARHRNCGFAHSCVRRCVDGALGPRQRSPAKRDTVNSRRCNLRTRTPKKPVGPGGPDVPRSAPPGLIGFGRPLSVGCTYGYSRTGPSRGHMHLPRS